MKRWLRRKITEPLQDDQDREKRDRTEFSVRSPWLKRPLARRPFPWLRTIVAWVVLTCTLGTALFITFGVAGRRFPMDHWAYRIHDDWYLWLRGNLWIAHLPWSWIWLSFAVSVLLVVTIHLLTEIGITRRAYILAGRALFRILVPRGDGKWRWRLSSFLRAIVAASRRLGADYSYIENLAEFQREKARIHADARLTPGMAWLAEFVRLTEVTAVVRKTARGAIPISSGVDIAGNTQWESLVEWLEALQRVETDRYYLNQGPKAKANSDSQSKSTRARGWGSFKKYALSWFSRPDADLEAMRRRLDRTSNVVLDRSNVGDSIPPDPLDFTASGVFQDCAMLIPAFQEREPETAFCELLPRSMGRIEFLEQLADILDGLRTTHQTPGSPIRHPDLAAAGTDCSLIGHALMDIIVVVALRTSWSDLPKRFVDAVESLRMARSLLARTSTSAARKYATCATDWLKLFSGIPRRADHATLARLEEMIDGRAIESLLVEHNLLQPSDLEFSRMAARLQELAAGPNPCAE